MGLDAAGSADLLSLADWLLAQGITYVAMESTGEFWKPVFAILEASFTVLVVNAQHIKQVPGRKTDVKDAEWIAELLAHRLLRASFIPPAPQRDLRDLTRQRTLIIQERAAVVNRLQKVLEWANLKLAAVATDVTGVSARAMLEALVDGQSDSAALVELARGRLRAKREALEQALIGRVREHHRFMLARHLELSTSSTSRSPPLSRDCRGHPSRQRARRTTPDRRPRRRWPCVGRAGVRAVIGSGSLDGGGPAATDLGRGD